MNQIRVATVMKSSNVDAEMAQEVAKVGILPVRTAKPAGFHFELGGQPFVVTGEATREDFIAASKAAGFDFMDAKDVPASYTFLRVTTD